MTAQLLEGATGGSLWAERYDRHLSDAFALQDEIAEQVAAAIEPEVLKKEGQRAGARSIQNLTAWDLVRRGTWEFHKVTPATAQIARDLFQRSIEADSASAEGYVWRTHGQILAYYSADDRAKILREGLNAARRAVQLDDKNPYSHYALAILLNFAGQFGEAAGAAQRSVALCPSFALGYLALGSVRLFGGQVLDAVRALEHGLRLNPFDPQGFAWHLQLGLANYFLERLPDALEHARRALNLRPHWGPALMLVALCSAELDDHDYAHEALVEMDALADGMGGLIGTLFRHNPSWEERIRARLEAIRAHFANGEASLPE